VKARDLLLAALIVVGGLLITASHRGEPRSWAHALRELTTAARGSTPAFPFAPRAEAPRAGAPITVDGDLREWSRLDPLVVEGSPSDGQGHWFSATTYLAWDDRCFYLASSVGDDTLSQPFTGSLIWEGDSIQFSVAPRPGYRPMYLDEDYEYGVALTAEGVETWRWYGPPGPPGPVPQMKAAVVRRDKVTTYEVAVPWRLLAPLHPEQGCVFGFSLLYNDNDGNGRSYYEWASGIASEKRTDLFGRVRLVGGHAAHSG
jgi:hypothetical protein